MKETKITLMKQDDRQNYEVFLRKNQYNLIYASLEFGDFLKEAVGGEASYYLAWQEDDICGVLPLFTIEHPVYGKIVNSLPWYGSYGGCTLSNTEDRDTRRGLLLKYADHLKDTNLFSSTLILSPFENNYIEEYQQILNAPFIDKRIGQITRMPEYSDDIENDLMKVIKQKTRNLVRKSMQQGFSLQVTDEDWAWKFLHETHVENLEAIGGKAKPWKHFESIRRNIPSAWRKIYVALINDIPVAAVLMLLFNKTAEYITPVVKVDYRSMQPLSFLIFNAMMDAIKTGHLYWNWGGTWITQQTLHHFKAGWGADDYPYTYLIHASQKSVDKIKKNPDEILQAFPYYYVFPFNQLS